MPEAWAVWPKLASPFWYLSSQGTLGQGLARHAVPAPIGLTDPDNQGLTSRETPRAAGEDQLEHQGGLPGGGSTERKATPRQRPGRKKVVGSRSHKKFSPTCPDRYSLLSSVTYTMSLGSLLPQIPEDRRQELLLPIQSGRQVGERKRQFLAGTRAHMACLLAQVRKSRCKTGH